jgi:hypothetical protein
MWRNHACGIDPWQEPLSPQRGVAVRAVVSGNEWAGTASRLCMGCVDRPAAPCPASPYPCRLTIASTHTGTYGGVQPFDTGQS